MAVSLSGPWNTGEIDRFLDESTFPVRLSCVGNDGFPRVVSLWYRNQGLNFHCVTHRESKLAKLLQKDARVGFEVSPNEPPYHGIRGQGMASLQALDQESTLQELLSRYLGGTDSKLARWLLSRSHEEVLVTIKPLRIYSWDYRERMADVG